MGRYEKFYLFKEVKCPVCEKMFIPATLHAYKDRRSPYRRVCSWHCVCESERLKEAGKKGKAGAK